MLPLLVVRGTIPLGSVDMHLSIECNVNNIYVYTYEHLGNELCYSFITLSFIAIILPYVLVKIPEVKV